MAPAASIVLIRKTAQLALELSPWKKAGEGKLPSLDRMKAYEEERDPAKQGKIITPLELDTMLKVDRVCQTCHNAENDPHFRFESVLAKDRSFG